MNRDRPFTTREKAARRRDRIAGIALFIIAVTAIALTVYVWWSRKSMG